MFYDLHCHSNYSDGKPTVRQIEEKCKRDGMGVVITDHNEIRGSVKMVEKGKVISVPALEAGSLEGLEFLMYFNSIPEIEQFYVEAIEPFRVSRFMVRMNIKTEQLLEMAANYDCFISLAHPYGFGKKSLSFHKSNKALLESVKKYINAVEIINGNTRPPANNKAKELSDHWNLKLTVGSDGHDLKSIGKVSVLFQESNNIHNTQALYRSISENEIKEIRREKGISKIKTGTIIAQAHTKYYFGRNRILKKPHVN